MQHNIQIVVDAYARHKNLKLAATELGMKWQSLYVHLKKAGVAVTGDKSRYGSTSDRLAVAGEREFLRIVPFAVNLNDTCFQPKCDFDVLGYKVDVKTSSLLLGNKRYPGKRWAFCIKKQVFVADFFVCLCIGEGDKVCKVLLMPGEVVKEIHTVSVGQSGKSKWLQYEVEERELPEFFSSLPSR